MQFTDDELKAKQERANLQRHEAVVNGLPTAAAWNDGYAHAIADLRQIAKLREAKQCINPASSPAPTSPRSSGA